MFYLTQDFEKASRGLRDLCVRMKQKSFAHRDFPFPVESVPPLDALRWNARDTGDSRCYNYALDMITNENLAVGDIYFAANPHPENEALIDRRDSNEVGFEQWAELTEEYAEKDGLIPLGTDFRSRRGGYPVALFLRPNTEEDGMDYHFYSLRMAKPWLRDGEKPVWAHKLGWLVRQCRLTVFERNDLSSVFTRAIRDNYNHFGGFYEVTPEVKQRALKVLSPEFINIPKVSFFGGSS